MKELYLAGGCFWGTEQYFEKITGVISTEVGYANGNTKAPTYDEVCNQNTGHAETVKIEFDELVIGLPFVLMMYFEVVNPISINRQGGDTGSQYRTGIYYTDINDKSSIDKAIEILQKKYQEKIAIEVKPLENYFKAEEYHQKYLDKHPNGYCHIEIDKFEKAKNAKDESLKYQKKTKKLLKEVLTKEQFEVTQNQGTEMPFKNAYHDVFKDGIYVDITTGEPLFISTDKFESSCGWPSFSKPIDTSKILERQDISYGRERIEVRSSFGDAHLGHVFEDGPKDKGGLRYCINSASLQFIPKESMNKKGYDDLLSLFEI